MRDKPNVLVKTLDSGVKLVRYDNIYDIFWYDNPNNNPQGHSIRKLSNKHYTNIRYRERELELEHYFSERNILTNKKQNLIRTAQKELSIDKEFLDIVYKAKSEKREFKLNKFGGNLSMSHYAANSDKVFKKSKPGAKRSTLNLAFQVGTISGYNYTSSFIKIIKTILMCQALNIRVNIDMFDSDIVGIDGGPGYVICNVAKSHEKLNLKNILVASHEEFFNYTLFNGYSAGGYGNINGYLPENRIVEDLGPMYDVIGGNTLIRDENSDNAEMISRILKIGIHG